MVVENMESTVGFITIIALLISSIQNLSNGKFRRVQHFWDTPANRSVPYMPSATGKWVAAKAAVPKALTAAPDTRGRESGSDLART